MTKDKMTSRRTGLWVGLTMIAVVGATGLSAARAYGFPGGGWGRGGGGPGEFMQWRIQRMLDKVGATDAQKAQIKATWEGLRPEMKALHEQKAQLQKQIAQAAAAPTIDTARVEQLRQQSVQLVDKTSVVLTRGLVATAQVLTPDQRKQVLAEMEKRQHEHGPRNEGQGDR
ncbi:MAG TPA: periplasmic heavy metal sensor [Polyangia bacterium]|jgi:Spy/CpxP family protein refolding chaperone|nr:periplasmic heavy metal sensor [Polyangia bacterium]